jgi:hypothetical protein
MELVMTIARAQKYLLLVVITVLGFSQSGFAASSGPSVKPSIGAMMLFGSGQMGNDETTNAIPKRDMLYTPVAVFAGFNIKKLRIGLNYEYNIVGQTSDPSSVLNQNVGGKGSAAGLRLEYYNGKTAFGLIYRLSEKYTLDKPTIGGQTSEYEGTSGYGIQFYRQIKSKVGIVADYSMGTMKSSGGISGDMNWSRASLGLVFTNFAGSGKR